MSDRPTAWNSTLRPGKPLKRTPLKRGSGPNRKRRINAVNRERKDRLFARQFHSVERVKWIQRQPCVVTGESPCVNAHVVARGMGGCNGTWRDIVPLVQPLHLELDTRLGVDDFDEKYGTDLKALAAEYAEKWEARDAG